jgi:carboxypeptidase C (cathepsin A)
MLWPVLYSDNMCPHPCAGESYAGIYVPNLVQAVVKGNEAGAEPHINMEGYLVGTWWVEGQAANAGWADVLRHLQACTPSAAVLYNPLAANTLPVTG